MRDLKLKICGMTNPANVEAICKLEPDYLGYIFYHRSVRYVGDSPDPEIFSLVPGNIKKTAVFVNEYFEKMLDLTAKYDIDVLQLHGMESPEICKFLKIKGKTVIKVFPGDQIGNTKLLGEYEAYTDYFLFDAPVKSYGGSGRKFDWSLLKELVTRKNFFLSGGITPEDAELLLKIKNPTLYAVDINSRFEINPGIKDPEKVRLFINSLKNGK